MPAPALSIEGLTLPRGGLFGVAFAVPTGALAAVVGPAGSGKSALMDVLGGFARQHGGSVLADGVALGRMAPGQRGFGVVRQPDRLWARLSLAENVALALRGRGVKRAARLAQAREMLELVQIEAPANTSAREVGLADMQRALLARAAVFGPSVMLLDEPFGAGDEATRLGMIAAVERIHTLSGATIVLATRRMRDALPLCSRMVVLQAGKLVQDDTPQEVFNRPASAFVAELGGETNRLQGTMRGLEDDICTIRLDCGPSVEARASAGLAEGAPCLFMVRPEQIAVAPVPAAEMGDGALDATLLDAQFWGDSYRLRLLIGSGAELIVRRPAIAGLRGLAPGRPCAVAWQSHHALAF